MAQKNYLITGLSGTGKSTVCAELVNRGIYAVDTDYVVAYFADQVTGEPSAEIVHENFIWNKAKALELLNNNDSELFLCGDARNLKEFVTYFDKIFVLKLSNEMMSQRLRERTNNPFGKEKHEHDLMLRLNEEGHELENLENVAVINAALGTKQVADKILGSR